MEWLKTLLEALFPFSCHVCKAPTAFGEVLCPKCHEQLQRSIIAPYQVTDVFCRCPIWAFGNYEGVFSQAIKAVKYRPSKKLLRRLLSFPQRFLLGKSALDKPNVIVPVPLHPHRQEKRGFNQAALIAQEFASAWQVPFCPALVRSRVTAPQAEQTEEQRKTNVKGAFAAAPGLLPSALKGKRVCVIDDVATTGSTLDECVAVIESLNPASTFGLVLAHSPKRFPG